MDIKCTVLENLVKHKRMPALFIGTGITKRYLTFCPNWDELLKMLAEKIGVSESAFAAQKSKLRNDNPTISNGILQQKMASYLQNKFLLKIESGKLNPLDLFSEEENQLCINGIDYFKMLVAKLLKSYELNQEMQEELKLFKEISGKISLIFTTNYDLFLETEIFPKFHVFTEQNQYYFKTATYGEIYKIHGSIKNPNSIILCENDYKHFDDSLKLVSAKLLNALMDFPLIFLGYSLEDENIKKILSDFVNSFDDTILQKIKKSIILVSYDPNESNLIEGDKQFSTQGRSIDITTIRTNNFAAIYRYIHELHPTATSYELRRYKQMLIKILSSAERGTNTIYVKNLDKTGDKDLAVYIATQAEIEEFRKSTILFDKNEILEKALFNETFAYEDFAKDWYNSKKIRACEYVPTFHIKHFLSKPLEQYGTSFQNNYQSIRKTFKNLSPDKNFIKSDLTNLKTAIEEIYKSPIQDNSKHCKAAKFCWTTLCANKIKTSDYQEILQKLYKDHPDILNVSEFKKAIAYLGYRLYENP